MAPASQMWPGVEHSRIRRHLSKVTDAGFQDVVNYPMPDDKSCSVFAAIHRGLIKRADRPCMYWEPFLRFEGLPGRWNWIVGRITFELPLAQLLRAFRDYLCPGITLIRPVWIDSSQSANL